MQIALREGRELTESDAEGTVPVAVISRSLARRYLWTRSRWGES